MVPAKALPDTPKPSPRDGASIHTGGGNSNGNAPTEANRQSILGRITSAFVFAFERIMPDPYVFAVLLTFIGALLAWKFAPNGTPTAIASAWYAGVFNIFTFAFQMVIMLVAGYALATSPLVHRGLTFLASLPKSPSAAIAMTVVVSMIASWLNWGLGLVCAALLAREVAKRVRVDFGWLVASAYTGFVISTEGISGSIALSQATHGSALNVVEKVTGQLLPLSKTVFVPFNLVPIAVLLVTLPLVFRLIGPSASHASFADPEILNAEDRNKMAPESTRSFGAALDRAWILNAALGAFGLFALVRSLQSTHGQIDLNTVILSLVLLGLLLHWRPINYVHAIKNAARVSGSMILQYPLYGGLMGIITATGLAGVISKIFIRNATAHTLPFLTYLTSLVITLFVPSGGGHWAVQGPFAIPAAQNLHASMAATTMSVAMGESVANMLQPFWALPLLAIAGIPMRKMMGFMVVSFLVSLVAFGLSLLLLLPAGA